MAVSNTQVIFDNLYGIFTYLAIIVGVIVFALMAYLIIRYRAKEFFLEGCWIGEIRIFTGC